jgi:hypothetical protein
VGLTQRVHSGCSFDLFLFQKQLVGKGFCLQGFETRVMLWTKCQAAMPWQGKSSTSLKRQSTQETLTT